ncbi:DUF6776 family protein [Dyella silvatica]|uniref:DUF6776 family protein n=1 Tax=Dyella silvatica TaxID=2992128 RepID=UPI0022528228|nr:DUF6776 family protein [Dyella silvatica]
MASRPPPRLVVRQHDDADPRRRLLWLALGWLVSLLLCGFIVSNLVRRTTPAAIDKRQTRELTEQNEALKQQVANLQRSQQVTDIATRALQGTMAEREEEINGLRADLGFYSRLVGSDAQRQGLKVQEIRLKPVADAHAWDISLSLTQNAKRGEEISGKVTLSVEGLRGDKVQRLEWPALGDAAQKDGLPFHFKYFQSLHATFVLPADFHPTRLLIKAQPDGDEATNRAAAWTEALSGDTTTQGNP